TSKSGTTGRHRALSRYVNSSALSTSVTVVAAANVNPLPAIVGRDLSPAGVVRVIVEATTKAQRDEIAIVEPMVETIMVVVPVVGPVSSSPHWPVGRRPVENWPISHRAGALKSTHSPIARVHCAWPWSRDWPASRAHRADVASTATHTGITTPAHSTTAAPHSTTTATPQSTSSTPAS